MADARFCSLFPWECAHGMHYLFSTRLITVFFLFSCLLPGYCLAAHGLSIDGTLKYPKGFSQFDYVAPEARVGGSLTLHDLGSFDKMNPFTLKGSAPSGLSNYVFETLAVASLD